MQINFNDIQEMTMPGMNNGTGTMSARMYNDDSYRIIPTAIHPGGSIGTHKQESGPDDQKDTEMLYLYPCFYGDSGRWLGSEHSIINTGEEDLVMLTIVVKK